MSYKVHCECGKPHEVTGADAGASLRCDCGRTIEVPPLHQLRTAAGEEVLSPAVRIETLLLEGKLPGTRECVSCFRDTGGLVRIAVECERGTMKDDNSSRDGVAAGCLFGLLVGGLPGLYGANRMMQGGPGITTKQVGQDVEFTVPLPVCEVCQHELNDAALRVALRHIPEYAALLDQYPDARVTRAG